MEKNGKNLKFKKYRFFMIFGIKINKQDLTKCQNTQAVSIKVYGFVSSTEKKFLLKFSATWN